MRPISQTPQIMYYFDSFQYFRHQVELAHMQAEFERDVRQLIQKFGHAALISAIMDVGKDYYDVLHHLYRTKGLSGIVLVSGI